MSTLLIPSSGATSAVLSENWPSELVVATDGRAPSDAAIVAARALAGTSSFRVISVVPAHTSRDRAERWTHVPPSPESIHAVITEQLRRVLGKPCVGEIELRTGYPPAVLASFAEVHAVPLLIAGIGRPRVLDRLLGDESVLRLARMMRTPLYAVATGNAVPPQRVVVGTDLSATSMRAARLALTIAAPDAEILLAHVTTPAGRVAPVGALRRQAEALQTGFCGHVRPIDLQGDAATELLALANSRAADAIAIGARGETSTSHGTLGAVATRVVRCARCSLIVSAGRP